MDTLNSSPTSGGILPEAAKRQFLKFHNSITKRYRVIQIHKMGMCQLVGMSKGPAVEGVTKRDSLKQGLTDKIPPSCPTSRFLSTYQRAAKAAGGMIGGRIYGFVWACTGLYGESRIS